ncbi:cilia- and flagella-associated protein 65 isoform X2 [Andrena cerasifolii]
MSDSVYIAGDPPPISLSRNFFNFGQTDVDIEKATERISHAICLTNHSQSDLVVSWEKDIDGIFNVTPYSMHIRAGQSVLFELSFNPCIKSSLFGRELVGSIFLDENKQPTFPFVTSIRMIGHSFPVVSSGWIPQYEMPQTVVMPPCVPPFPVYRTFLIKRLGHLPLMFEFVPPSASHFTVKPMIGVIYQSYQIITIEMAPEPKNEQIYIERWTMYFNGNTVDESYIDFKGYAEYANIMFWNQNTLSFPPILPCCQQFEQLGMRNVTRHRIQYRFHQMPDELKMEYPGGEIDPNDTVIQECSFQPVEANVNYDFEVQCVLIVLNNETTVGVKGCITLRVRGRSETGSLVAIPKDLYFGELEYNTTKTLSFDLFNFSAVNIYYRLVCTHCNWPFEDIENDVVVRPASETVFSNSHQRIMVSVTPRTPGYYEFAVEYLMRVNYRSDALLSKQCPIRVANMRCICVVPTLKVKNVCAFGSNQKYSVNISKSFLWESMQINKLNRILENVLPGERKTLTVNLFPMVINEGALFIKLVMVNPSTLPVSWISKRIRRCDCKPIVKRIGLSTEQEKLDCVHQSLCSLYPKSKTLKPKRTTIISIKINYTLIGKSEVSWDLDVGHDRHIILNISIDCLSKSERQYSFLNIARINFGRIYLGNKQAVHKTYWIHNVTNNDLLFSVDIDDISKLNKACCCEVFSCLTQSGIVKAETSEPLLLRFQPRMLGAYKVRLPITLGDKEMELTVEGESSCDFRSVFMEESVPPYCACKTSMFPVYFNTDCINMWAIPTYSFIVKMLLIYNNFQRDALAYEWKCEEVREILQVEVFPRKGIMNPNTVQSFRVKIFSKGQPCRIDVNIPCEFFNASERRKYQRSIIEYDILSKELEGQFTITEKGTSVPKPWIKILNKPELLSKPLSLRCSIYPVEDERSKVTLMQQLKAAPTSAVYLDDSKNSCVIQDENELSIATFILEGLLWDCVNSRRFKKTLRETLIPRRNLYYSQFMMDLQERRRLIRRSFIVPPFTYIASILEEMLFIIVHQEFSLGTIHLIPDDDARHINYLKTLPKQNKISQRVGNYDTFYDMLVNDADVGARKYARSVSRVSFAD